MGEERSRYYPQNSPFEPLRYDLDSGEQVKEENEKKCPIIAAVAKYHVP